jgi:DNA photolyase
VTTQSVVWFRRDLRLADNPAWAAGTATADRVTALYVLDPTLLASAGPFRRAQLLAHLHALDASLRRRGGRLLVRHGRASEVVAQVTAEAGASAVHANADATPYGRGRRSVTAFVDTDVPVRHLTGDPPEMVARATAYLSSHEQLLLTDSVAAESVYVLESFYEAPRDRVAQALRSLIAFESVFSGTHQYC